MDRTQTDTAIANVFTNYTPYENRVRGTGALTHNHNINKAYLMLCEENGLAYPQFAWLGESASKYRTSGIYNYFSNIYSLFGTNDAAQATTANQPILVGNIAPNEKYAMCNPNGGSNFMSHTPITYASIDMWSATFIIRLSTFGSIQTIYTGGTNTKVRFTVLGKIELINESNTTITGTYLYHKFIGKNTVFHTVANGSGSIGIYANGTLTETLSIANNFTFTQENTTANPFYGVLSGDIKRLQTLSSTQVLAEANWLKQVYPEIPSVTIGSQIWATSNFRAVCTPQGNLIQEIQAAANVEKVTNGGFATDTTWLKQGNWSISGGVASNTGVGTGQIYQPATTIGKWYKVTFTIVSYTSGTATVNVGSSTGAARNAVGTYTDYLLAVASTNVGVAASSFLGTIDNLSCQEVGWSDSQNLYDAIYAATSGTTEQKTYAAVKAAAMWCGYNNDVAFQAVYGKQYNWFAVKLLQMDIDYYNTANPATPWGWKVPLSADYSALATYLGGTSVAGGHMKLVGTTYYDSPNTGADNTSGFSAIQGNSRGEDGIQVTGTTGFYTQDSTVSAYLNSYDSILNILSRDNRKGNSIRLIKV